MSDLILMAFLVIYGQENTLWIGHRVDEGEWPDPRYFHQN